MKTEMFVVMCEADGVTFPVFVTPSKSSAEQATRAMQRGKTAAKALEQGVRRLRFYVAQADYVDPSEDFDDLLRQWTAPRRGIKLEGI